MIVRIALFIPIQQQLLWLGQFMRKRGLTCPGGSLLTDSVGILQGGSAKVARYILQKTDPGKALLEAAYQIWSRGAYCLQRRGNRASAHVEYAGCIVDLNSEMPDTAL